MKWYNEVIEEYRKEVDRIDNELIYFLFHRFEIVSKIGDLKKDFNLDMKDELRWNEVLGKVKKEGVERKFSEEFIEDLWNLIHKEVLKINNKKAS